MKWLINIFGTSDYAERKPYYKFVVGLAHAFGGALLAMLGLPLWLIAIGYTAKEVAFDIRSVNRGDGLWRVLPDSIVDLCFTVLGAAMIAHGDARYGFAALIVGSAYFVAGKVYDNRN